MSFNPLQALFGSSDGKSARARVENMSANSAVQFFTDKETIFVDVRGEGEISASGTIKGALVAPLPEFTRHAKPDGSASLPATDAGKRIILVCASGMRSGAAAKQLINLGYENVANISGGIGAWARAGGAIQR